MGLSGVDQLFKEQDCLSQSLDTRSATADDLIERPAGVRSIRNQKVLISVLILAWQTFVNSATARSLVVASPFSIDLIPDVVSTDPVTLELDIEFNSSVLTFLLFLIPVVSPENRAYRGGDVNTDERLPLNAQLLLKDFVRLFLKQREVGIPDRLLINIHTELRVSAIQEYRDLNSDAVMRQLPHINSLRSHCRPHFLLKENRFPVQV